MTAILKKKLTSRRGAAIAIALVFFLFAAILGGIVLASASANAGRLSHMRAEQQAYLNVGSAAALLCEELEGLRFQDAYTIYDYGLANLPNTLDPSSDLFGLPADLDYDGLNHTGRTPSGLTMTNPATSNSVTDLVFDLVQPLYEATTDPVLEAEFEIEPDNGMDAVHVRLALSGAEDTKYALIAELTLTDSEIQYPMNISIPVNFSENVSNGTKPCSYLDQDAFGNNVSVPAHIPYSKTTTDITYGAGVVTRGGA